MADDLWWGWWRNRSRDRWKFVCAEPTYERCLLEMERRAPPGGDRFIRQGAADPNLDGVAGRKEKPR